MKKNITLLIVDKNPNVRHLIGRELSGLGFRVILCENAGKAIEHVKKDSSISMVVLDPDLPDIDKHGILETIFTRKPYLPVIIHTFTTVFNGFGKIPSRSIFIEKQGNSIDHIKQAISRLMEQKPATPATR